MNIEIKTIPHTEQRYSTCGDWILQGGRLKKILVSDMGNEDYAFLVGIHEAIEAWLCTKRGITQKQVDEFDVLFEWQRDQGLHSATEEPGNSSNAPYRKEHQFATKIERLLAKQLGVNWEKYEKMVEKLFQ